nr:WG repeat-containing protein [Sphingomonas colocasiae]
MTASISAASSPDAAAPLVPRCGGPFRLCGHVDQDSGIPHIPFRFEIAQHFSEGLAAVRTGGRFGYIDRSGKLIIPARYRAAGPFLHGYAEVRTGRGSGIIDRTGRFAVLPNFDRIMPFGPDSFIATPRRPGRAASDVHDGSLSGFPDPIGYRQSGAGLYHIAKGWLTAQDLSFTPFDGPGRDLVWAAIDDPVTGEKWGLIRADGSWQVRPRYSHVERLDGALAVVSGVPDGQADRRDAIRSGVVDRNGRLVIPLQFDSLHWWGRYGLAAKADPTNQDGIHRNPGEAIVRPDGTLLTGRYFDKVDLSSASPLPRVRTGDRWYGVTPDGVLRTDPLDGKRLLQCPGGLSIIQRGDLDEIRHGMPGRLIGRFDHGYGTRRCDGPLTVRRNGRSNIISQDGRLLGGADGFEDQGDFRNGFATVRTGGKWGLIDGEGRFTAPPTFDRLTLEGTGVYRVGDGDAARWIDVHGKPVARPPARRPNPERALTCPGGLRLFERRGLWGFRDANGQVVIGPRYRALSCFDQGVSWTAASYGSAWCPIGPDGARVAALGCRQVFYPYVARHSDPEFFDEDPYENSVLWTRALLDHLVGKRAEPPGWVSPRALPTMFERWRPRALIGGVIVMLISFAWLYRRRRLATGAAS